MKDEFANPFLQATKDVFRQMLGLEIERGETVLIENIIVGNEVNVMIGVVGELTGTVTYSFSKFTALEMVKSMAGMDINELDIFATSALGEVGNIVSGNAVRYLENANCHCDIVPPQIILSENKSISFTNPKSLLITVKTKIEDFTINIALKEKATIPA
jgi:chemotaxis protein CheX